VIAIAGFFTVRTNVASTWRQNYEAEHEARLSAEARLEAERARKHEALNELAAQKLRTDMRPLIRFATEVRDEVERHRTEDVEKILAAIEELRKEGP